MKTTFSKLTTSQKRSMRNKLKRFYFDNQDYAVIWDGMGSIRSTDLDSMDETAKKTLGKLSSNCKYEVISDRNDNPMLYFAYDIENGLMELVKASKLDRNLFGSRINKDVESALIANILLKLGYTDSSISNKFL